MKTTIAWAVGALLLAACSARVDDGDAGAEQQAPDAGPQRGAIEQPLPACSGDLGPLVTCCEVMLPGPHPKVCGCAAGPNGPNCTHGAPLCFCPSGECVTPDAGPPHCL